MVVILRATQYACNYVHELLFVPFNLVKPCFNLILLKKFFTSSPMLTYCQGSLHGVYGKTFVVTRLVVDQRE